MPSPMPAGQYSHAAQAWHASILFPLCSVGRWSVDGLLALEALEAQFTVQHFADRLSTKWSKPHYEVMV